MSKRGIRFSLIIISLVVVSCINKRKENQFVENNFFDYSSIYRTINDSIKMYLNLHLKQFIHIYNEEWQIDSLICINSDNDKLVTTINNSNGIGAGGVSDAITKILGKKINGQWYFLEGGGTLIVPRDMYSKNSNNPLSFHELSQIARKEFLSGAIIKKNGKLIINDEWVDAHFYNNGLYTFGKHRNPGMVMADEQFQMPRDKAKFDSVHWALILDKWKHRIDTITFKKFKPAS